MGAGLHQMAGGAQPPASSSSSSSSSFPSSLTVLDQRPNSHTHSRGIRFLNTDWNDSISNGDSFGLKWNVSVAGTAAKLGLFKVTYPENGVVVYEFASNLTGMWLGTLTTFIRLLLRLHWFGAHDGVWTLAFANSLCRRLYGVHFV